MATAPNVTPIKPPPAGGAVYRAIAAVQGALSKVGIAKNRRNQQGSGYNFRGIDDVYSALSPLLAEHGLVIVPRLTERVVVERQSKAGGALFNVTVKADFDFIAAEDGSIHTASTYGEAMDSADKATNKAMSAAYKYAAFMTFAIPTEGDNDADAETHEVAAAAVDADMPDAEWAKLVGLIKATTADTGKMLSVYQVKNLRHLNQEQYAHALGKLTDKLALLAKAETDAKAAKAEPAKRPRSEFAEILNDDIAF